MLNRFSRIVVLPIVVLTLFALTIVANDHRPKHTKRSKEPLTLIGAPVGPTQAMIDSAKARVERSDTVRSELVGKKYRLMSVDYVENGGAAPLKYRVVIYDYSNDRTLVAESDLAGQMPVTIREQAFQPMVNDEEFDEATTMLRSDPNFSDAFKAGIVKAYRAMPDVTVLSGTIERLVNVGLSFKGAPERNEIVSVSIKRAVVIRYESKAPPTSNAAPEVCGIPDAGEATTGNGTAGQFQLTVLQGPTTIWEILIVRPSASSGTRKSGIEIQNVKYKGKTVLKRGHAPVLNVQYVPRPGEISCGPYRDWQWQEDNFQTPATGNNDAAPGFRIVATGQIATTALESGQDAGNFRGVGIYQQDVGNGPEVVLITELQAGWYRYVMEWRFATDGTIRPRYGFGAVDNPCVCARHHHHVYWRFDFDVVNPINKVFQIERGRKFLKPVTNEMSIFRNYATNRGFLIQNSNGNEAYEIIPGRTDGYANYTNPETGSTTTFGRNDFWIFQYKSVVGGTPVQNEIDDGFNQTTSQNSFIQIDSFLNNESLVNQDVVVWYGAHFIHADATNLSGNISPEVISGEHVVGPDLRPVRW